jgi:c(7)-type cytochrome triheme protein
MTEHFESRSARRLPLGAVCLLALLGAMLPVASIADDTAIRDYTLSEVEALQDPRVATDFFPRDRDAKPDWVDVLRRGLITPRETLRGEPRRPEFLGDPPAEGIVFRNTAQMPYVVFPHQAHTEWLACTNCHDDLFERRATGQGEGMVAIFMGRHCGTCHGKVAFSPIGSCYRCHSLPNPTALFTPVPDSAMEQAPPGPPKESTRRRRNAAEIPLRQPSPAQRR